VTHIHCIIHSVAYTPKVIAKIKAHQGGESVFLVTKSYKFIDVIIGEKIETWSIWRVIRWIKSQKITSFTAHFLSSIAAVLINQLDKSTTVKWVVWGGDFYDLPKVKPFYTENGKVEPLGIKQRLQYKLINKALPKIDCIIANICDHREISTYLNLSCHQVILNFLLDKTQITTLKPQSKLPMVLIGNSDDPNNRHLTVIHQLTQINGPKNGILPLSGVINTYTTYLKSTVRKKFPSMSIDYLDRYIQESKYFDLLSSCSHLAFGHLRQQGMATLFAFLVSGRVCYMQSNSPYYQYLIDEGLTIYALDTINNSISEITSTQASDNKRLIEQLFALELIDGQWKQALTYLKPSISE
jgi:hypothetical protein